MRGSEQCFQSGWSQKVKIQNTKVHKYGDYWMSWHLNHKWRRPSGGTCLKLNKRMYRPSLSYGCCILWTLQKRVSCATVLGYSRLLPARCSNMPHVTRNPWQQLRLSLRNEWLPRVCGHPNHPTWSLLISFYGTMLRNKCSITNRTQLTHRERTLQMESGKLTAWYCNATSRCAWWRMVVFASTWCDVNFFSMQQGMCPISIITFCSCWWSIAKYLGFVLRESPCSYMTWQLPL
jgi:hypothetical protein